MHDKWGNMPTLDRLKLSDTSQRPVAGTIVPCLLCGNFFIMKPYAGYPDQCCGECFNTYSECATIICVRCKVAIAKVRPHVTEDGFYVKKRAVLHSDCCPICNPGLVTSTILEVEAWNRRFRPKKLIVLPSTKEIKTYG